MNKQNKKNPNKITLILTDRELSMLESIKEREGQTGLPTVIHSCIVVHYNKLFPAHYLKIKNIVLKGNEPVLTNEQKCERVGGTVQMVDGVMKCVIRVSNSMTKKIPLDRPDLLPKI